MCARWLGRHRHTSTHAHLLRITDAHKRAVVCQKERARRVIGKHSRTCARSDRPGVCASPHLGRPARCWRRRPGSAHKHNMLLLPAGGVGARAGVARTLPSYASCLPPIRRPASAHTPVWTGRAHVSVRLCVSLFLAHKHFCALVSLFSWRWRASRPLLLAGRLAVAAILLTY